MKTLLIAFLLYVTLFGMFHTAFADSRGWERAAIVMASQGGLTEDKPLKFAYADADRVGEILKQLGDIPSGNIFTIQSESVQEIRHKLKTIAYSLSRIKQSGKKIFLQFYYSGHGGQSYFHLGGERLAFSQIKQSFGKSVADAKVFILDVCYGASFFTAKGFKPVDTQPIKLHVDELTRGEVIITASSLDEQAYEVIPLKGSIFTNHWLMALRGAADENQDGSVSLFEAYNYTYHKTVAYSSETLNRPQHPTYAMELQGGKDLILTRPLRGATTLRFENCPGGNYSITDVRRKLSIGDIHLPGVKEFSVALEPGVYEIYTRHPGQGPLKARVSLAMQGITSVPFRQFKSMALSATPPKVGKGAPVMPVTPSAPANPQTFTLEAKYMGGLRIYKDNELKRSLKQTSAADDFFRFSRENRMNYSGQIHGALFNIRYRQWLALGAQFHILQSLYTQTATGFENLKGGQNRWIVTQESEFKINSTLYGPAVEFRPFRIGKHSLAFDMFYGFQSTKLAVEWSMQRPLYDHYESSSNDYSTDGNHVSLGFLYGFHPKGNSSLVPHFDLRLAAYYQTFSLRKRNASGMIWRVNSKERGLSFQLLIGLSSKGDNK